MTPRTLHSCGLIVAREITVCIAYGLVSPYSYITPLLHLDHHCLLSAPPNPDENLEPSHGPAGLDLASSIDKVEVVRVTVNVTESWRVL